MDAITESFHIILQNGIEGGFAPPTPNSRSTITRAPNSTTFTISTEARPHGTPRLVPVVTARELSVADNAQSIAKLQDILRRIPTQHLGVQDVYGRNTSIVQATDPGRLHELRASAMGAGAPRPTEEQRALFDEAVGIIERWGDPNGPSQ